MLFRYLRSSFLCWFGDIVAIVGLIVWSVAIFVAGQTAVRKQGYYQAPATTTGKRIHSHVSGGRNYSIDFRYTDGEGKSHNGSTSASGKEYSQTTPGQQFPINVPVVNPNDAWAVSGEPTHLVTALVIFLA